jgi:hypothetical protein
MYREELQGITRLSGVGKKMLFKCVILLKLFNLKTPFNILSLSIFQRKKKKKKRNGRKSARFRFLR